MSEGLLLFCPAKAISLCDSFFKSRWKDIEEQATNGPPIQAMVVDGKLKLHLKDPDNPWIKVNF